VTPAAIWRCSVVSAPMVCKVVHRGRDSTFEFYLTWVGQGGGGLGRATGVGTRGSTAVGVLRACCGRAGDACGQPGQPGPTHCHDSAGCCSGCCCDALPSLSLSSRQTIQLRSNRARAPHPKSGCPPNSNSAPTTSRLRDKPTTLKEPQGASQKETTSGEPAPVQVFRFLPKCRPAEERLRGVMNE